MIGSDVVFFLLGSERDFGLLMDDGFNGQIVSYGCRISLLPLAN